MLKRVLDSIFSSKNSSKKSMILKMIYVFSFITFIISALSIVHYYANLLNNQHLNKQLASQYKNPSSASLPAPFYSNSDTNVILPDFFNLYKINKDIKGYISIPHTVIDYPVVQTNDNSYYLNHAFNKSTSKYGTLFIDFRNVIKPLSQNIIIYGHNMKDGQMFHSIINYQKADFYNEASLITFNTIYNNYQWKVFAAFIANSDPENGYAFNYTVSSFTSGDDFMSFIKEARARSLVSTPGVDIKPDDTILTLSTCAYEFKNARFVVMARRLRPGEDITVSPAVKNNNAVPASSPLS